MNFWRWQGKTPKVNESIASSHSFSQSGDPTDIKQGFCVRRILQVTHGNMVTQGKRFGKWLAKICQPRFGSSCNSCKHHSALFAQLLAKRWRQPWFHWKRCSPSQRRICLGAHTETMSRPLAKTRLRRHTRTCVSIRQWHLWRPCARSGWSLTKASTPSWRQSRCWMSWWMILTQT